MYTRSCLVTDAELKNPEFVRDVRNFACAMGLQPSDWKPFLTDELEAYPGKIINRHYQEVELNLELFELDDETILHSDSKTLANANDNVCEWFETWCCTPCPDGKRSRLNEETKEKFRIVATILRARNPGAAQFWGLKGKAANDNNPQD
ncbi:MAG: hypothetical protein OEY94_01100 [Alphaproteobacteria bacterium]|nr:hypothetical protein [Alphaproteobacteria bacterium]